MSAAQKYPVVHQWMNENYGDFLAYALKRFPRMGTHEDREDAIGDLVLKALSEPSFERRLLAGKELHFSTLLEFCKQRMHAKNDHEARCLHGRAHGKRTRKEVAEGKIEYGVKLPDWGAEAILLPKDKEGEDDGPRYDVVDPGPSPLECVIVDEMFEMVAEGMLRNWEGQPLEVRLRMLQMMLKGGNQGDLQKMLGVGATRTKSLRTEIKEAARHSLRPRKRRFKASNVSTSAVATMVQDMAKKRKTSAFDQKLNEHRKQFVHGGPLQGSDVPQHNRLETIKPALKSRLGKRIDMELPTCRRSILFMEHAMRILGVLDEDGRITELGEAALKEDNSLSKLFAVSPVGSAWMVWSGVKEVAALNPDTAFDFLKDCSVMSESTCKRRSRALVRWIHFLRSNGKKVA